MSTSKTKKLPPGVTNVASDGTVSGLTIAELARQVGKELGVQSVSLDAVQGGTTGEWYRIAKIKSYSSAGILIINHTWGAGAPSGVVVSYSCAPKSSSTVRSLVQVAGSTNSFQSIRMVYDPDSELASYLEIFVKSGKSVALQIQSLDCYWGLEFYQTPQLVQASSTQNPLVCEFKTLNGSWRE